MKRQILVRIILVPFKIIVLVLAIPLVLIPCSIIGESQLEDEIFDAITSFGNYKKEKK